MAIALQPVACTVIRGDGLVHFGDILQLANVGSASFLHCDIEDRVSSKAICLVFALLCFARMHFTVQDTRVGDFSCAISASASNSAVACNTFLIAKYSPAQPSIYDREYSGFAAHTIANHVAKARVHQHHQMLRILLHAPFCCTPADPISAWISSVVPI